MLTGLLRCPLCHRTMVAARRSRPHKHDGTKHVFYRCKSASASRTINGVTCYGRHLDGNTLEEEVVRVVTACVTQPELLTRAFENYQAAIKESFPDRKYSRMKRELTELEKTMHAAVQAQIEAKVKELDETIYEKILRDTSARRIALRAELANFEAQRIKTAANPTEPKNSFCAQVSDDIIEALSAPEITPPEKQRVLARIIESVYPLDATVKDDAHLRIAFRVGVFKANQRWIWNDGNWEIKDVDI